MVTKIQQELLDKMQAKIENMQEIIKHLEKMAKEGGVEDQVKGKLAKLSKKVEGAAFQREMTKGAIEHGILDDEKCQKIMSELDLDVMSPEELVEKVTAEELRNNMEAVMERAKSLVDEENEEIETERKNRKKKNKKKKKKYKLTADQVRDLMTCALRYGTFIYHQMVKQENTIEMFQSIWARNHEADEPCPSIHSLGPKMEELIDEPTGKSYHHLIESSLIEDWAACEHVQTANEVINQLEDAPNSEHTTMFIQEQVRGLGPAFKKHREQFMMHRSLSTTIN